MLEDESYRRAGRFLGVRRGEEMWIKGAHGIKWSRGEGFTA